MDSSSFFDADMIARAILRERTQRRDTRLGNRARVNLTLLYRGWRASGVDPGHAERPANVAFDGGSDLSTL
jgi:hypothetical protein